MYALYIFVELFKESFCCNVINVLHVFNIRRSRLRLMKVSRCDIGDIWLAFITLIASHIYPNVSSMDGNARVCVCVCVSGHQRLLCVRLIDRGPPYKHYLLWAAGSQLTLLMTLISSVFLSLIMVKVIVFIAVYNDHRLMLIICLRKRSLWLCPWISYLALINSHVKRQLRWKLLWLLVLCSWRYMYRWPWLIERHTSWKTSSSVCQLVSFSIRLTLSFSSSWVKLMSAVTLQRKGGNHSRFQGLNLCRVM